MIKESGIKKRWAYEKDKKRMEKRAKKTKELKKLTELWIKGEKINLTLLRDGKEVIVELYTAPKPKEITEAKTEAVEAKQIP